MKASWLAIAAMAGALGLAACQEKGPAQRAGQSIDNAAENVGDAISPPGPVERAGRSVDRAVGNK